MDRDLARARAVELEQPHLVAVAASLEGLEPALLHGSLVDRRAAFDNAGLSEPLRTLVDKVAHHADAVTDHDVAAVRATGLSEDQIFEIVVCAAIGQADRQYTSARAALWEAAGERESRR